MSSENLHEREEVLKPETLERHRAIVSIMEELEAVDWYQQRVDGAADAELAAVLAHNRDEEKEHAAMTIEWLRRNDPKFDEELRTYLFTDTPIVGAEAAAMARDEGEDTGGENAAAPDVSPVEGSLGIGSLRGEVG